MSYVFHDKSGTAWMREWIGGNEGRYEWSSSCGVCRVWRDGHKYLVAVSGNTDPYVHPDLLAAMRAAVIRNTEGGIR